MTRLSDDIFQAQCQIDDLSNHIEDGGKIVGVEGDVVTIDLPDDSYTEVNLSPIVRLLSVLRARA